MDEVCNKPLIIGTKAQEASYSLLITGRYGELYVGSNFFTFGPNACVADENRNDTSLVSR